MTVMTTSDLLVATLNATFPWPPMSDATYAFYVAEFDTFRDREALEAAVLDEIRSSDWLPKIAAIHKAYERYARAYAEKREAEERECASEVSQTRGLPAGQTREPIPAETVEWLRQRGHDVDALTKRMDVG